MIWSHVRHKYKSGPICSTSKNSVTSGFTSLIENDSFWQTACECLLTFYCNYSFYRVVSELHYNFCAKTQFGTSRQRAVKILLYGKENDGMDYQKIQKVLRSA